MPHVLTPEEHDILMKKIETGEFEIIHESTRNLYLDKTKPYEEDADGEIDDYNEVINAKKKSIYHSKR